MPPASRGAFTFAFGLALVLASGACLVVEPDGDDLPAAPGGAGALLELGGEPAGIVDLVQAQDGGRDPCGATTISFALGADLGAPARAWLGAAFAGQPQPSPLVLYLPAPARRLVLEQAVVVDAFLPGGTVDYADVARLTMAVRGEPASCQLVPASAWREQAKLATTFADAWSRSDLFELTFAGQVVKARTVSLHYSDIEFGSLRIELDATGYAAAEALARSIVEDGEANDDEFGVGYDDAGTGQRLLEVVVPGEALRAAQPVLEIRGRRLTLR
ncbi:MAG: hypothetical protein KA297_05775 [Kofleriaceae bacterium]|nr:hypothetical protein [Kofleriaceae bacterium]MBP6838779.1 hypothetical protein [Kofleriaceae bacterium]